MLNRFKSKTLTCLVLIACSYVVSATHCLSNKPALLGSKTKDGSTTVTTWAQTPYTDNYLIGGTSNSADFTEQAECATNVGGCAFLANWNSISSRYEQKWVFTQVYSVREIHFQKKDEVSADTTFALVFDKRSTTNSLAFNPVMTFNTFNGRKATLSSTQITLNEPFEKAAINSFSRVSLWYKNTFNTIINNPSRLQSTDYFIDLNKEDNSLKRVYSDVLNTANKANIHLGTPTRKYAQGYGYDDAQIVQLATITVPRGEKELGGVVTLGEPRTYQVIITRAITDLGTPFTYLEKQYATKQVSPSDYYYYTDFTMSYLNNADGQRQGKTVLHTVGSHISKQNEIQITSFEINFQYDMVANQTRIYNMDTQVQVIGIQSRPENDPTSIYKVWVTYQSRSQGTSFVGKVLYANLKDDNDVKMFDFTDQLTIFGGNAINRKIVQLEQRDNDHYLYSGYTNYYPDFIDFENYDIDWTATDGKTYGFFTTYSSSDHCDGHDESDNSVVKVKKFGPELSTDFTRTITSLTYPALIYNVDEKTIKEPPITQNTGDLDAADYAQKLAAQRNIETEGFLVETQNWQRTGNDANGLEYKKYLFEIDGTNWLNRFGGTTSVVQNESASLAITSMQVMGVVGMVNTGLVIWWFVKYVIDYKNNNFWWVWLSAVAVNGLLWIGLFFSLPVLFFAGSTTVNVVAFLSQMTLIGAYFAYWINIGAMAYVFYVQDKADSGSLYADTTEATYWFATYSGLCLLDAIISIALIDGIVEYRDQVNLAELLAEEQAKADEEAAASGGSSSSNENDNIFVF